MSDEKLFFNGINAATGDYLTPALTAEELSKIVRREPQDETAPKGAQIPLPAGDRSPSGR